MTVGCPFCDIANTKVHERLLDLNDFGIVIRDGFFVADGHTLIIPRCDTESFFDLSSNEQQVLLTLLNSAKRVLDTELAPDSYTIGINDGPASGQTVPHVQIHLIPRYQQTGTDPRGGVRWVIPEKADNWSNQ